MSMLWPCLLINKLDSDCSLQCAGGQHGQLGVSILQDTPPVDSDIRSRPSGGVGLQETKSCLVLLHLLVEDLHSLPIQGGAILTVWC